MANGAHNENGPCMDAEQWISDSDNTTDDMIRSFVQNVPYFGSLAGLIVPETKQINALRLCPGATIDHSSSYTREYALLGVIVALIFIYVMLK